MKRTIKCKISILREKKRHKLKKSNNLNTSKKNYKNIGNRKVAINQSQNVVSTTFKKYNHNIEKVY